MNPLLKSATSFPTNDPGTPDIPNLLKRIVTVSLETTRITRTLPELPKPTKIKT